MSLLVRILLACLAALPRRLSQFLGSLVGRLHHVFNTRAAMVTDENLKLCLSDYEDLATLKALSLIQTAKTMLETPAVWLGNEDKIQTWIAGVENESLFLDAVEDDKGLLVLLPHTGNWELFNVYVVRHTTLTALYNPPRQPFLQSIMAEIRDRRGNTLVPATRRGITQLYKALDAGDTVLVLPDQIPGSGRFAPFFGEPAFTDELSARMLQRSGARCVCVSLLRQNDGRFIVHFQEPDELIYSEDMNQALAAVNRTVEAAARLDLSQYQWEYKRFRERPSGERKLYRFGKTAQFHQ